MNQYRLISITTSSGALLIRGGKKLIYPWVDMPLTAIADFEKLGKEDPFYAELDVICKKHNGLWSVEAERYLLKTKAGL